MLEIFIINVNEVVNPLNYGKHSVFVKLVSASTFLPHLKLNFLNIIGLCVPSIEKLCTQGILEGRRELKTRFYEKVRKGLGEILCPWWRRICAEFAKHMSLVSSVFSIS